MNKKINDLSLDCQELKSRLALANEKIERLRGYL